MNDTVIADIAPNAELVKTLHDWSDLGWLRRLDSAMATFVQERDPKASAVLLTACTMLTHMEGRGHTCLPLASLVNSPPAVLAWPQAAHADVQALWATLPSDLVGVWVEAIRSSRLVRHVPMPHAVSATEPDLGQPFVLSGTAEAPLLYLRRYWVYEAHVAASIAACTRVALPVDMPKARFWLDKLFDAKPAGVDVDWQKAACAMALRGRLTVITGGPGTGKTYTAARLLALLFAMNLDPANLKVALAAPTGKAAARLRQSIDQSLQDLQKRLGNDLDLVALTQRVGQAKTVHSLLGARPDTRQFKFDAAHPLDVDVLIVDETSMVHLEMMAALLQALPAHAKLVLLGDKDQLASVEAGAVLGDLCAQADQNQYTQATVDYVHATCGELLPRGADAGSPLAQQTVMLRHSIRFGTTIGQFARAVNDGDAFLADALLEQDKTGVIWQAPHKQVSQNTILELAVRGRPVASASYSDYLNQIKTRPAQTKTDEAAHVDWVKSVLRAFDRFRILCAVHDGPWGDRDLNRAVQRALAQTGLLNPAGEWFVGRPVMVTRNDPALGVFNGDVGVVLPPASGGKSLRAYFLDGEQLRSVSISRLAHVETAFAMTVHKAQGSEFLHTVLVLPSEGGEVVTRELVYTGITRAKTYFSLVQSEPGLLAAATRRRVMRASGLQMKVV